MNCFCVCALWVDARHAGSFPLVLWPCSWLACLLSITLIQINASYHAPRVSPMNSMLGCLSHMSWTSRCQTTPLCWWSCSMMLRKCNPPPPLLRHSICGVVRQTNTAHTTGISAFWVQNPCLLDKVHTNSYWFSPRPQTQGCMQCRGWFSDSKCHPKAEYPRTSPRAPYFSIICPSIQAHGFC